MSFPRYPAYKPSGVEWLGDVPAHWDVVQFKQYVDIQNGADHKHIEQADGYPVLGSGGLFTYASDFLYDGESVLLGRKGTIDKPLHVTGRFWTVDTMYWTKIKPNASGRFAYYLAVTIPFDYYSTNTALPSMTKGALNSHFVAQPPLAEQTRIAEFLDGETGKIDGLVAEQRRLLALLKEKRQAVISHAVTRGLNAHAPLKPSGIEWLGDVPAHWDVGPLKRYWSVTDCKHITAEFVPDGIPLASIREVQSRWVTLDNAKRTTEFFYAQLIEGGRQPLPGDLIFSRNATVGEVAQVSAEHPRFAMGQDVVLLRKLCSESSSDYLQHIIRSPIIVRQLDNMMIGSTFKRINVEEIRSFMIPSPPANEQDEIASFLEVETARFDTLTAEAERAIELLQERRSALISAAVTGQIDVRAA
jgi:type I restriction enzyme S subunit